MGQRQSSLEKLVTPGFWEGKRVFLTGHTGFKGAWLSLLLQRMRAEVFGYALAPETEDGTFTAARVAAGMSSDGRGDIRDLDLLKTALRESQPEIVFHLAAQSLVRASYRDPVGTYATNVGGTVNLLEAVRGCPQVRAVIVVTSDKCYENREWPWAYREIDPLGGRDPYSSSKACAELVVSAFRRSFFAAVAAPAVASVRAGNVIGGGDWAEDRLMPDAIRAFSGGTPLLVRSPNAFRPWQHVLEPLGGYILLAECLVAEGHSAATEWNFGPSSDSFRPVHQVADMLAEAWKGARWRPAGDEHLHEATLLQLDSTKARLLLGWSPLIDLETAVMQTIEWYKAWNRGADMRAVTLSEVDSYLAETSGRWTPMLKHVSSAQSRFA